MQRFVKRIEFLFLRETWKSILHHSLSHFFNHDILDGLGKIGNDWDGQLSDRGLSCENRWSEIIRIVPLGKFC
jgi:hypothetical protein